jgi:hypothetical protein
MEISIKYFSPDNQPEKSVDEKINDLFLKHNNIYITEFCLTYSNSSESIDRLKDSIDAYYKTLSGERSYEDHANTYYVPAPIPGEGLIQTLRAICLLCTILIALGSIICLITQLYEPAIYLACSLIPCLIYIFFFKYLEVLGERIKDLEREISTRK